MERYNNYAKDERFSDYRLLYLTPEGNESEVFVNKLLVRIDRTAVAVQQTEQDAWVVYPIPARDVLHISGEPVDFV